MASGDSEYSVDGRLGRHKGDYSNGVDMMGLDICDKHARRIQYHCKTHDELCCDKCMFVDHRKCESISEIQDLVDEMNTRGLDEDQDINTSIQTVNKLINGSDDICKEIDQKRDKVISFFEMEKEKFSHQMLTTNENAERMSILRKVKADLQKLQKVNLVLCEKKEKKSAKVNKYIVHVNYRKSSEALSKLIETEQDLRKALIWNKHLSILLTEQLVSLKQTQASLNSKVRRLKPMFMVIFIVIFGICINAAQKEVTQ